MYTDKDLLYEGKGKKVYQDPRHLDQVILFFKDDLTAYQASKKSSFQGKGLICKEISSYIFRYLKKEQIPNHWIQDMQDASLLCQKTKIIPLEVVVRNRLAGSTAKRLGFEEGSKISGPLLEFYYKQDKLDDPFCSEEQISCLKLIEQPEELPNIKKQAQLINKKLQFFFSEAGLELVDFKLEFGMTKDNMLILSDDISPDSCRLWDIKTGYRMDKDRFRLGLGKVDEGYSTIRSRIIARWQGELHD